MLGKYIVVNSVTLPNPKSFSLSEETVENVYESEAGTDLAQVVRLGKVSAKATFQVTSLWRDRLKTMTQTATQPVTIDGQSMTMRLRDYSAKLVENSENIEGTDGLWTVSINFIEV